VSPWKRLSSPTLASTGCAGVTRVGLWSLIKRRTRDVNQLSALLICPAQIAGVSGLVSVARRAAEEADRSLLVRVKEVQRILESTQIRVAGHQTAVVPPVESNPRQSLPRLILHMGRLVKRLVVVRWRNT